MAERPDTLRLLVTAGPTQEPIDRVRYIGNRSSGRMGLALAEAALKRGCAVTLLLGPTALPPPEHSRLAVRRFRTAAELRGQIAEAWPGHDVLVMAAAVADFTPASPAAGKLERDGRLTLELEPTPDLVAEAAASRRPDQRIVGFALEESGRLEARAAEKLRRKGLDAIVANPLETMDAATVTARVLLADGTVLEPPAAMEKPAFAEWLLERVLRV